LDQKIREYVQQYIDDLIYWHKNLPSDQILSMEELQSNLATFRKICYWLNLEYNFERIKYVNGLLSKKLTFRKFESTKNGGQTVIYTSPGLKEKFITTKTESVREYIYKKLQKFTEIYSKLEFNEN
jgi:hypothetical protein